MIQIIKTRCLEKKKLTLLEFPILASSKEGECGPQYSYSNLQLVIELTEFHLPKLLLLYVLPRHIDTNPLQKYHFFIAQIL